MVWKLHSFWDGLFSGAMLVSGSVVSFEQICWQKLCDFCKYQPLGCESQSIILRLSTVPAVFILRIGGLFARSYNDPWFFVSCDKLDYVPFPDFCGKRRFRFGFPEPKRCQWQILVLTAITGKGANPSDKVNFWWGHPFMLKGMLSVDPWMFGTTYYKKTMN